MVRFLSKPAFLVLADGTVLEGESAGADGIAVGELVFNTAMTGYQEILTDPSYAQQIVTLTTAHVGNTGCNDEDVESSKTWASGLVIRECSQIASNYRSTISFSDWLRAKGIVAIAGIDTRYLTQRLRDQGVMGACICNDVDEAKKQVKRFQGLSGVDLACLVSTEAIQNWTVGQAQWSKSSIPQQYHVVVYDFGVKHTILRILYDLGCRITLVPAKTSAEEVLAMQPDGVVLSNGPGDPQACDYAIQATKEFLAAQIPLLGICLGFQIMALACGATSLKMKFGHHGANHPVLDITNQRVYITSQNHGFAIDERSLPKCLQVTHRSLFDNSLQGIQHKESPAFGFQGHPEASPGPHEIEILFMRFINLMKNK